MRSVKWHRNVKIVSILSFLLFGFLFIVLTTRAEVFNANRSTNSLAGATTAIFNQPNTPEGGDILTKICVNQPGATPGTLAVYDSSGQASGLIGTIDISTGAMAGGSYNPICHDWQIRISSSISITRTANGANITIFWFDKLGP